MDAALILLLKKVGITSLGALSLYAVSQLLARARKKPRAARRDGDQLSAQEIENGSLDVRRQYQVVVGGATDHAGDCVILPISGFTIEDTIFRTLDGFIPRMVITSKIGVKSFWDDGFSRSTYARYALLRSPPTIDDAIVSFMRNECDFSSEHADGSFMDHLRFCYEYSCSHYAAKSPLPLLLHSICGVATNVGGSESPCAAPWCFTALTLVLSSPLSLSLALPPDFPDGEQQSPRAQSDADAHRCDAHGSIPRDAASVEHKGASR